MQLIISTAALVFLEIFSMSGETHGNGHSALGAGEEVVQDFV